MAQEKDGKGKNKGNTTPTNEADLMQTETVNATGATDAATGTTETATDNGAELQPLRNLRDLFRDLDNGGLTFQPSDSDKVYEQNGVKSQKIGSFILSFCVGNAGIPGSIYKRTEANRKPYAEAAFVGTRQASAIKCYDEASKMELAELKHEIAVRFAAVTDAMNSA